MAIVSFIIVFAPFFVGYFTKNNGGVPLPIKHEWEVNFDVQWKRFDIWGYIFGLGVPESGLNILLRNISTWFVAYSVAYILTHVEPQRRLLKPFKFNPNHPRLSLVGIEILRSTRGVLIASIYEIIIQDQYVKRNFPIIELPVIFQLSCPPSGKGPCDVDLIGFLVLSPLTYFWADSHFY